MVGVTRLITMTVAGALVVSACTSAAEPGVESAPAVESASADSEPVPSTEPVESVAGTVPAPDFPTGLDWLNIDQPLDLQALRGKVVLLDFWTYGCINCIHIIPDLKRLEAEYPDELVVIGVHSA